MAYLDQAYGWDTDDPTKMYRGNRNRALSRQQQFWDESEGRMLTAEEWERKYGDLSQSLYDPLISGGAGYTDDERDQIIREQELGEMDLGGEDWQKRFLTDEELTGIRGTPEQERRWFDPNRQTGIQETSAGAQRGAVGEAQTGMGEAATGLGARDKRFTETLDNISTVVGTGLESNVGQTGVALSRASEDPSLAMSGRFSERYPMSDEERQAIISGAGLDVRDRYAAAQDAIRRRAEAEGSLAPGEATRRLRFEQGASSGAADAMTRARIGASSEAARRELGLESTRLGSEQERAGLRMRAGEFTGSMGERAWSERGRLAQGAEEMKQHSAEELANLQYRSSLEGGRFKQQTEQGIGQEAQDVARDVRNFGSSQDRYIDQIRSQREAGVAENRQGTETGAQQEAYRRKFARSGLLSDRWRDTLLQRKKEEAEARDWATRSKEYGGQQRNAAAQQQIGGFEATSQAAGQAAGQGIQYKIGKKPGLGSRVVGGVVGGALGGREGFKSGWGSGAWAEGGIVTKPTVGLLGEKGPEMVVPLRPGANTRIPPRYADLDRYSKFAL